MTTAGLRVLHLLGEIRQSGAETMLAAAGPSFAARGVACDALSTGATPGPFAERLAEAGFGVLHLPFVRSPSFFLRLGRLLRSYDVLHLHTERASFWIGLTACAVGVPVTVRSIHNAFAFEGGLRVRRLLQRRLLGWLGVQYVAVSRSVQETELRRFGHSVEVVDNWFDEHRFRRPSPVDRERARGALGIAHHETALVSIGNCNHAKNHEALLRALALLSTQPRPLYLHVGTEEPGAPEQSLATQLGLGDRVRFLGPMADVRVALYAADGFVMPSTFEGLPISALEALATGLPAILTDVPGLRDLSSRFPGVRVAAPTPASLASALASFLSDAPALRWGSASGWPELARRSFGIDRGVDAYVRLYRRLGAPPARRGPKQ